MSSCFDSLNVGHSVPNLREVEAHREEGRWRSCDDGDGWDSDDALIERAEKTTCHCSWQIGFLDKEPLPRATEPPLKLR